MTYEGTVHLFHFADLLAFACEGIAKYELERTHSISSSSDMFMHRQYLSSFLEGIWGGSEGHGAKGMEQRAFELSKMTSRRDFA